MIDKFLIWLNEEHPTVHLYPLQLKLLQHIVDGRHGSFDRQIGKSFFTELYKEFLQYLAEDEHCKVRLTR